MAIVLGLLKLGVIIVAASLLVEFLHRQGTDFMLGALFAVVAYQCSHRAIHGRWIDL